MEKGRQTTIIDWRKYFHIFLKSFRRCEKVSLTEKTNALISELVFIERKKNQDTHFVGKYNGAHQFMIYRTFVFSKILYKISDNKAWKNYKQEYMVLYLFNSEGELKQTDHLYLGTSKEEETQKNNEWIEEKLSSFDNYEFKNIAIKPFKVEIDGFLFGLADQEEFSIVEILPNNTLKFNEPRKDTSQ